MFPPLGELSTVILCPLTDHRTEPNQTSNNRQLNHKIIYILSVRSAESTRQTFVFVSIGMSHVNIHTHITDYHGKLYRVVCDSKRC